MNPRPSLYSKAIIDTCKVDLKEARLIEQVMRDSGTPTLDHLDSRAFNRLAKKARKLLQEDPELRKLLENS